MKDYTLGKIYKMISPSGLIYVGSTCEPTLARRKAKHHNSYKSWKRGKSHFVTSYKLFDEAEDSVEIVLLEACPCGSKDELYRIERYHIDRLDCVNKNRPSRTDQENLDQRKQYNIDNKDKIADTKHQYYLDNKDTIAVKQTQKFECVCNGKYTRRHKQLHTRTNKHQQYIREQQFYAYIQTNPSLDDAVKNIDLFR